MPYGKGTYGSKRGRPPKKSVKVHKGFKKLKGLTPMKKAKMPKKKK
jgi:hypothetical protein